MNLFLNPSPGPMLFTCSLTAFGVLAWMVSMLLPEEMQQRIAQAVSITCFIVAALLFLS